MWFLCVSVCRWSLNNVTQKRKRENINEVSERTFDNKHTNRSRMLNKRKRIKAIEKGYWRMIGQESVCLHKTSSLNRLSYFIGSIRQIKGIGTHRTDDLSCVGGWMACLCMLFFSIFIHSTVLCVCVCAKWKWLCYGQKKMRFSINNKMCVLTHLHSCATHAKFAFPHLMCVCARAPRLFIANVNDANGGEAKKGFYILVLLYLCQIMLFHTEQIEKHHPTLCMDGKQ